MKNTIGILGLGSRSTIYYIDRLNTSFNHKYSGFSTMPFVLMNINFNEINPYLPNQFENIIQKITPYLKKIESIGITHLLIPNITLHQTLDKIIESFSFKLIHPLDLLAIELQKNKINEVVVFGTLYTMESNYISDYLKKYGIQIKSIDNELMRKIDEIRKEVYEGENRKQNFENILNQHSNLQIVIACTELSIIAPVSNHIFDLATLQIEETIKLIS